ncbi:MAG: L,D-transpeptidase [Bacteroidales bacterium]|nr:L,D-transpeptidase [Bacteroidales bacterium]
MDILIRYKTWFTKFSEELKIKLFGENEGEPGLWEKFIFPALAYISVPVILFLIWTVLFGSLPFLQELAFKFKPQFPEEIIASSNPGPSEFLFVEENRIKKLSNTYARFSNRQPYLVVNTSDNTFRLYNNGKQVREGICSTGSYVLLDAGDQKQWRFETPKGVMRIQGKTESPVWRKPDWAFIEEGLPVPKNQFSYERYEYGVLGDYALSIGNGFLIHGTLYKRLLGMPVTHGCVRMDDADLEQVYRTLNIGSKVYIF